MLFGLNYVITGLPRQCSVKKKKKKKFACQCLRSKGHGFHPWVGKILWGRKQQPTEVFLGLPWWLRL